MFTLKVNDKEYKVTFKHDFTVQSHETLTKDGHIILTPVKGMTICGIVDMDEKNNPVTVGLSFCSKKDQWCYNTGRKKALLVALDNLENSRLISNEQRVLFWNEYFKTRNGKF